MPNIRVEILTIEADNISAAFYYQVPAPQRLPDAVDPDRTPHGVSLSNEEKQDLKDGKIYEILHTVPLKGRKPQQVEAMLQQAWAQGNVKALDRYRREFRTTNKAWDGAKWINV